MDMSIIIPCHNLENFITPLLVSLKLQVLEDKKVELIFVCDACTDKTESVIAKFQHNGNYAAISVYRCDAKACGLARNVGLENAKGEYILFLDGDDWLTDPFAILYILNAFKTTDAEVIQFDYEAPGFHAKGHPSMVWQYAYRRDIIGETRFQPIQPDEDLIFNRIIRGKIDNLVYLDRILYHYNYMRQGSNMQQMFEKGKIDP